MDNNHINKEFLVEKIEKHNAQNKKENQEAKRNLFILAVSAILLANIYLNRDFFNDNYHEVLTGSLLVSHGIVNLVAFIALAKNIMRKIGLFFRNDELESLIRSMANTNKEEKGMSK
ncbi:MAG: hypothetical protein FWD82_02140 [Defluviitaleaceae bacterium]|nr:hypothetical protein [Defluviitaleaceae bacterium]